MRDPRLSSQTAVTIDSGGDHTQFSYAPHYTVTLRTYATLVQSSLWSIIADSRTAVVQPWLTRVLNAIGRRLYIVFVATWVAWPSRFFRCDVTSTIPLCLIQRSTFVSYVRRANNIHLKKCLAEAASQLDGSRLLLRQEHLPGGPSSSSNDSSP